MALVGESGPAINASLIRESGLAVDVSLNRESWLAIEIALVGLAGEVTTGGIGHSNGITVGDD